MVSIKSLVVVGLASLATARPNPTPDFQVTNLNTFEPTGRPEDTAPYRVGFNVTDPSDSATAFCETRWPYSESTTGYPHNFLANCTDPSWAFKFDNYVSYYNFTLDVKHTSKNHDRKTTRFAKGAVSMDILQCSHAASGFSVCNQKAGVAFPLDVYDVRRF